VKFKDEITPERLKALAALSLADGVAMREWRYGYMSSGPSAMPALLRRRADIHVPPDPADASELLTTMFTEGMDQAISVAADRFEAVLGADSQAMMHVHLAEINLVTTGGAPTGKGCVVRSPFLVKRMSARTKTSATFATALLMGTWRLASMT